MSFCSDLIDIIDVRRLFGLAERLKTSSLWMKISKLIISRKLLWLAPDVSGSSAQRIAPGDP
jgi:hypothetical protein